MKKIITSILLAAAVLSFMPELAMASPCDEMKGDSADLLECVRGNTGYQNATETSLSQKIGEIIKIALSLVGMIFLVLMIYAGFLWMTASGEEEKVTKATNILKAAVIGLIIIVAAYSLTTFVLNAVYGAGEGGDGTAGGAPAAASGCCEVCGVLGFLGAAAGDAGCGHVPSADNASCQDLCDCAGCDCTFTNNSCP